MNQQQHSDFGYLPELEQQLLGALLDGGGNAASALPMLSERSFVSKVHAGIFEAIRTANERYSSTALPVVARVAGDELKRDCRTLAGQELAPYLASLSAGTIYNAGTIHRAARNVLGQTARVLLAQESARLTAAASDPSADPLALVRTAGASFDDIMADVRAGGRRKSRVHAGEAADNAMNAARAALKQNGLTGITTGLLDLDRVTGGFQRRDLILIAARPSMGKTTFGTGVAIRAARAGYGVGVISLEMDADKLASRCISDIAYDASIRVPYADVIRGAASASDLDRLADAAAEFGSLPLWIEDTPNLTLAAIRTKVEALMADAEARGLKLELLIVDHLGLIAASSRYSGNRVQEIGEITAGLKQLAREYGIALALLCQLSRAVETREDKRPMLSDLRDSGAIEQDADTVLFLYRESYYLERQPMPSSASAAMERAADIAGCRNALEIIIAKQRNGAVLTVPAFIDIAYSAVRNAARHVERYNG